MNKAQKKYFGEILYKLFNIRNHIDAEFKSNKENVSDENMIYRNVRSSIRYSGQKVKYKTDIDSEFDKFIATPIP